MSKALLLIFLGAILVFMDFGSGGPALQVDMTLEWKQEIRSLGGYEAYLQFARHVQILSPQQQHTYAHQFGAALYTVEGLEGLGVCDSRFSYGCFHEFLGRAIAEHGLGVVFELNEGCITSLVESPLSCQHGIGHGIQAYLGYDESALANALHACEELPFSDPIGGCYGGLFMEYNLRTMLGSEAVVRPLVERDFHAPCTSLSGQYIAPCYFWQPQWWGQVLNPDRTLPYEQVYARMGEFCREGGHTVARPCFEGIGTIVPADAGFLPETIRTLCEAVSSDSEERLYCKSLAANSLAVGGSGVVGDAEAVCEGLTGDEHAYCIAYANNLLNIAEPGTPSL